MGIDKLTFYYPLPRFGQKFSAQIPDFRENFSNLASLIRAAQVDVSPTTGEHDLARWMVGELDFRNRYGMYYDKAADQLTIQYNSGTEAVPIWNDALIIRDSDNRVIAAGAGGFQSLQGFYTPNVPSVIRIQTSEPGGTSLLASIETFDSTFFYIRGDKKDTATISFKPASISSSGGVTDHGALTGLSDDDHTQYSLTDGTRAFTDKVTINAGGLDVQGDVRVTNHKVVAAGFYTPDGGDVTGGGGSGETNTASNLGSGTGIFAQKSGVDFQFKSLLASGGIRLSNTATDVTISQNQFYVSDAQDVSKAFPSDGQVMTWDSAARQWGPATASAGSVTFKETEANGFSSAATTVGYDSDFFYLSAGGDGNPIVSLSSTPSAFSVHKDGNNQAAVASDAIITWEAVTFDVGGDFDLANNQFVAPSDGLYNITVHIATTASSVADDNMKIAIEVDGVALANGRYTPHANGDIVNIEINRTLHLVSGEAVTVINNFNASVVISGNDVNTWFSGYKLIGTG